MPATPAAALFPAMACGLPSRLHPSLPSQRETSMRQTTDTAGETGAHAPALGEAVFRVLVDSIRDYAVYMLDPRGVVVSWNSGAERIKGYSADEVIGQHFQMFYLPEERDAGKPEQELQMARESGRFEVEAWCLRKDGSRFRAYVVVTALRNSDGELLGFAKVTQDITARWQAGQELWESEKRFRLLVDQVRDYAIFLLSPHGRITTWNRGAHRMKGYTAEEAYGRSLDLFYLPEDIARGKPARLLRQAAAEGVAHDIGWRQRKNGERFWADVTITALYDSAGKLYGYAKVVRDLTEQLEAEQLARAYEAAREAIKVRDEFLSIASHELRTPLTALNLQLQGLKLLLERNPAAWNPERTGGAIGRALESAERLSQLVDTLLDVSRISTGRIELKPSAFDLAAAVRGAIERLAELIRQASCDVHVHAPETLEGRWDQLRVEQALMNLISNACKYAPNSRIDVRVERDGERVRLSVTDTGPGIAPENLDQIFARFERGVSSQHYGGLGLGLFVTRQIAEAHGGRAWVESTLGQGSTFTIELPLVTATDPAGTEQG